MPDAAPPPPPPEAPQVLFRGQSAIRIPLDVSITVGRSHEADLSLIDPTISRQHAAIERSGAGFRVRDLGSKTGSMVNGRLFEQQELVFGDILQFGPFCFRFDGTALVRCSTTSGGRIQAVGVTRKAGARTLLNSINIDIEPGHFVGILGTSGAGKSTLLNSLSGLQRPDGGKVLINGVDVYGGGATAMCGYVPQDDIVHSELTVEDALRFSASLRLPGSISDVEIDKAVKQTLAQLRLEQRANVRVGSLSGGQRKRVSIGAELVARPPVLFLDEPSSGLDPATEFALMELLRQLANTGCTVICTTHVMENVFLMDEVVVLTGGRLVYDGPPREVLSHFGIQKFSALYDRLEERKPEEWAAEFKAPAPDRPPLTPDSTTGATPKDSPPYFGILLRRQWALLASNSKNFLTLLGQPLLIALLVSWMAPADNPGLKLFLAWLATFWFGCGNAAEDIVGEIPIYRRERIIGLGRHHYLFMKCCFFGAITCLQAMVFFLVITISHGSGVAWLQIVSLVATSMSAVGIGLAISARVKTKTQAVRIVPLILLPQIIFSGFVIQLPEGPKADVAAVIPGYSSERLMEVSLLNGKDLDKEADAAAMAAMAAKPVKNPIVWRNIGKPAHDEGTHIYEGYREALFAMSKLFAWTLVCYFVALLGLRQRERK